MSAQVRRRRDGTLRPSRYRAVQPLVVLWLAAVWVALWGDLSFANAAAGVVIGVAATFVFPLPPLRLHVRLRPGRLAALAAYFLVSVVKASIQVAWLTLRPGGPPRGAVVAVPLRTPSDFVLTMTAEIVTLVPGSVVVEVRRQTHTLFVHVLAVEDDADAEAARADVLDVERRVVYALGAEVAHVASEGGPT